MVIFRVGFQISNFCFEKNSTRKKAIFHPEKSHAWKKAIFRVEFFFKKFFTGLENGQNHLRNSKLHAFDLELLKNPRAEKNLPRKMAIFHAWDLKIFSCDCFSHTFASQQGKMHLFCSFGWSVIWSV